MKFQPIVSIIVPVYNAERYLHECIKSILSQTLKEFELILVDDGSTDSSGDICDAYANKDNRIVVIHTPNQKSLLARKTGVEIAKGKYTYFVDSDDFLTSRDSLATMVALYEWERKDILSFSIDVYVSKNPDAERGAREWHAVHPREIVGSINILESCFIENQHSWVLWNKLFRTDFCKLAFSHIQPIAMRTAEDAYIYFLIVFFSRTYKSIETPPLYTYRIGSGITSQKIINLQQFTEYCKEIQLIRLLVDFLDAQQEDVLVWDNLIKTLKKRIFENVIRRYKELGIDDLAKGATIFLEYYKDQDVDEVVRGSREYHPEKLWKYKIIDCFLGGVSARYRRKYQLQVIFDALVRVKNGW